MSISVMDAVDRSDLKPGLKWTLHQMANRVNDEGRGYFEAVETLAQKTGHEPRTIQRHLSEFRKRKLIVLVREAEQRRPAEYRLDVDAINALPRAERPARKTRGDKMSPQESRGDISASQGRQIVPPGATNLHPRGDTMSPDSTTDSTTDPTMDSKDAATPAGHAAAAPPSGRATAAPDRFVVAIPMQGNHADPPLYRVTAEQAADWAKAYPAVDVPQQLQAIRQWNLVHPENRKVGAKGVQQHIVRWLAKAQNSAPATRRRPVAASAAAPEAPPVPRPLTASCSLCGKPAPDVSRAGVGRACDACVGNLQRFGRTWRPERAAERAAAEGGR